MMAASICFIVFRFTGSLNSDKRIKLKAGCGIESNLVLCEIECGKEKVKMIHILKKRKKHGIDIFRIHF